tara:strand:+ start:58 stop:450 length:393 start_codon:yes stop_codon:yes gene_type:complete
MPYQGRQPGLGVRSRFVYIATNGQTSFSGSDSNSLVLRYDDGSYVDVYLNGALLIPITDYAATTKTSVVLSSGAATSDTVEILAYDIGTLANTYTRAEADARFLTTNTDGGFANSVYTAPQSIDGGSANG